MAFAQSLRRGLVLTRYALTPTSLLRTTPTVRLAELQSSVESIGTRTRFYPRSPPRHSVVGIGGFMYPEAGRRPMQSWKQLLRE